MVLAAVAVSWTNEGGPLGELLCGKRWENALKASDRSSSCSCTLRKPAVVCSLKAACSGMILLACFALVLVYPALSNSLILAL